MLQNFSQSQSWLLPDSLLFDEIYESMNLMDFQSLPTPPQSPPMKAGAAGSNPLSKEDQLSYVSNILLEDQDMQFSWACDFFQPEGKEKDELSDPCSPEEDSSEECLWQCLADDKALEDKLVLGSSPLLPEMNTGIFEGMADSMLDCQSLMNSQEQPSEATSDYGSTGGELSTCSSSDSGEFKLNSPSVLVERSDGRALCRDGPVVVTHLWELLPHNCFSGILIDNPLLMFSGT